MDRDMEKKMRLPQFWFSVTYRVLRIILSRLCIGRFEKKKRKIGTKAKRNVTSLLKAMEEGPLPFRANRFCTVQSLWVIITSLWFLFIFWLDEVKLLRGCCGKEAFLQRLTTKAMVTSKQFWNSDPSLNAHESQLKLQWKLPLLLCRIEFD